MRTDRPPSGRGEPAAALARALPLTVRLLLLSGAYFAAGKLGLSLALVHPSATAVWPPTGIALAGLLVFGTRAWPAVFAGAFLVNVTTAGSVATSIGIATGNTLEALLGAWLVMRFANGMNAFDRAADAFKFAILAGLASTTVSATFGVTSLALGSVARASDVLGPMWVTWWLGDLGGSLLVAPALILWSRGGLAWSPARAAEAAALLLSLVVLGWVVFGGILPVGLGGFPVAFVCLPPLIWAAFRFDQRMAAAASLTLATVAVWGTVREARLPEAENLNLLLLQLFLGVVAVTSLALAALVAERRHVEATIRAASERMRAAMTELEAFGHSISHDLRTPIGAVLNYAALIEQDSGRLEPEDARLLGRIRASAESAVRMLDQLVRYMWIERAGAEFENVDMTSIAREAFAELDAGREGNGGVRLALADLPAARGSPTLLLSVFRNLFSNSLKHTSGRPERRIEVAGVPGARENTYVVADNGPGFDPQLGESLYQPFFRAGQGKDGSGLGLAIVAKIVRRHGGRVWAESDGSNGARFCFTLPSGGGGE